MLRDTRLRVLIFRSKNYLRVYKQFTSCHKSDYRETHSLGALSKASLLLKNNESILFKCRSGTKNEEKGEKCDISLPSCTAMR